jgi:DNA polymerase I-like protein with 3'-5' exonuclease and polymerase domains
LLKIANKAGATFRLLGAQIRVTVPRDEAFRPVLAALKAEQPAVWRILGGAALDAPPLNLITKLGVEPVVPLTEAEARELIAEMEADSDAHTPEAVKRSRGGLLGLDLETAANPGEEKRPPARLRLKDGLPAKSQPAFKGGAALDPHRSTIRLVQLYGGGRRCLVLDTRLVPIGVITAVLSRRVMVAHNASFELRFLLEAGLAVPRFEDTMQAAGLLLGAHRRSLEEAADAYLGIDLPKGLQRSDWSAPRLSLGQIAYAALDAIVAFRLWPKLRTELREKQRGEAYVMQRDVTPATVRMMARGVLLDRAPHRREVTGWRSALEAARKLFTEGSGQPPPDTPNQVRAFLTRILPADVIEGWPRTGKQQALSVKVADLKRHISAPAIRELLAINAMTKLLSGFGEELAAKVSARTGRLHPSYNVAGTKAGRFSASNPNVQQIPKHKAKGLRGCFNAAPGMKFVIGDYSGMELRAAAAISGDQAMNRDFADGVDLHRRQAAEMLGIPQDEVTDQQRDTAKPICFGTIYGAGPRGLAASAWANYGLVLPETEAEAARQALLGRYPGLAGWMDTNFVQSNRLGCITIGRLGRVIEASWEHQQKSDGRFNWRFPEEDDEDLDDEEEDARPPPPQWRGVLKRTLCCNAPIQGACADAAMLALTLIDAAMIEAGIQGGPVLFVHDEIVLEVPEADAERAGVLLRDCMTKAFRTTFPDAPLVGLVELKIRDAWGDPGRSADGPANRGIPVGADGRDSDHLEDQQQLARGCGAGAGLAVAANRGNGAGLATSDILTYRSQRGVEIWPERFANYERERGHCCYTAMYSDGWVTGAWSLGGSYKRHADYHGAYPLTLLKNLAAFFFDRDRVLHVCSGALQPDNPWLPGDTLDINPDLNPTYCTDAETCEGVPLHLYDTVFVDGPYTDKDAGIYGTKPINRGRVLGTLAKGLPPGALIIWLDEVTPPYRKEWPLKWQAMIAVSTSGGHRARVLFVYEVTSPQGPDAAGDVRSQKP